MKNILFLLAIFLIQSCAFAQETIRVGISNDSFSTYAHSVISVSAADSYEILSNSEAIAQILPSDLARFEINKGKFNFYINDKLYAKSLSAPIQIKSSGKIELLGINRKGKQSGYEGYIELLPLNDNTFNIVNVIDFQTYLKAVVPNEMPVSFGLNALKAQAVAARNYAVRAIDKTENYDICDSTSCQVYFGAYTRTALSDRAVDETNSIVALYEQEPILALYSSTAGGYTENYENAFSPSPKLFPSFSIPYLKAVPDTCEITPLNSEDLMREFLNSPPKTAHDINSPYFRWTMEWQKDELVKTLNKTLKEQSPTGYIEPAFKKEIKDIKEINVVKRGDSGKAMEIELVTDNEKYSVKKELVIRRVFKNSSKMLPSANVVFDVHPKTVVAKGAGFGHGVGMSQYGAGKMSLEGVEYDKILKHYYSGISLGTLPVEISDEPSDAVYSQEFYVREPKAYIVIDNLEKIGNFTFIINDNEFTLDMDVYPKKIIKIGLDKYLKKGLNSVTYKALPTKGKVTKVWVEIIEN